jgi:hypothetical protein
MEKLRKLLEPTWSNPNENGPDHDHETSILAGQGVSTKLGLNNDWMRPNKD